jgi:hypothetical protein
MAELPARTATCPLGMVDAMAGWVQGERGGEAERGKYTVEEDVKMITAERIGNIAVGVNGYSWNLTEPEAVDLRNKLNDVLDRRKEHAIEIIKDICSQQFKIPVSAMEGPARPDEFCRPRHAAMWLSRQCGFSHNIIGKRMGNRDHGTVIHACSLVKDRMDVDAHWRTMMVYLADMVTARTGIPIIMEASRK